MTIIPPQSNEALATKREGAAAANTLAHDSGECPNAAAEAKRKSRGWSANMSDEAIAARLHKLDQLRRAWLRLHPQKNDDLVK